MITLINSKRIGRAAFWAVALGLTVSAGWRFYAGLSIPSAQAATVVPYTVMLRAELYDKAGVLKATDHFVEAVRSDNSRMLRAVTPETQQRQIFRADGTYVLVNERAGKMSTYPNRAAGPPTRDPLASCQSSLDRSAGWVFQGQDVIGGHLAARIIHTSGERITTRWFAIDAACAEIQSRFEHETGVTEKKLEALILGEPDPALFSIPETFREVPPGEFFANLSPRAVERYNQVYFRARGETR